MIEPRTCFLIVHLAGLALGLGAAVMLDLHMVRLLRGERVGPAEASLARTGSLVVAAGLALLWISGAGLVALALEADPLALTNPKLQAKIAVVLLLTANGLAVHGRVLPLCSRNLGQPLFAGLSAGQAALCLAHGAISASAWTFAFLLGAVRELNFAAELWRFLAAFAALLALVTAATLLLYRPAVPVDKRAAA